MSKLAATLALALCALAAPARAADPPTPVEPGHWKLTTLFKLNLSQSTYSSNWAGGDHGSVVWVLGSDTKAERQFSRQVNWANQLQLNYGQTLQQEPESEGSTQLVWASPRKTTDLIQLESTARFTLGGWVDPYASLRFDSQFRDESNPYGAINLNPIRLMETAGMARVFQKTAERELISRLGLGLRETFSRTIVDPVTKHLESYTARDGGLEFQTQVTQPMLEKKVLYKGKLLVFLPVYYSRSGDLETFDQEAIALDPTRESVQGFWRAPDVNFQNELTTQITKLVGVSLIVQLVYDKYDQSTNVDPKLPLGDRIQLVDRGVRKAGQLRETLALTFSYTPI
jgi:hypothetical protein